MNVREARQVLLALAAVDGGCSCCGPSAIRDVTARLPEAPWKEAAISIFESDFPSYWFEDFQELFK